MSRVNVVLPKKTLKLLGPWLVVIVSFGLIYFLSATTTGIYSPERTEVQVSFQADLDQETVLDLLRAEEINITSPNFTSGNLRFSSSTPITEIFESSEAITSETGIETEQGEDTTPLVTAIDVFTTEPQSEIRSYFASSLGTVLLLALVPLFLLVIPKRRRPLKFSVQQYLALIATILIALLVITGAGVLLSRLTILDLNPVTRDLYFALIASIIVISFYTVFDDLLRKRLLSFFFSTY